MSAEAPASARRRRPSASLHAVALGLQEAMQHKADFALGFVSAAFPLFVQYYLWSSLYARGYSIPGYAYADALLYSVLAAVVGRLVHTGFEYEVGNDIKHGGLARYLVQPVAYVRLRLAHFVGGKLPMYAIMGALLLAALAFGGAAAGERLGLLPAVLAAVALGVAINFLIFLCVSFSCFWFDEAAYLFEGIRIGIVVLSGGIVPLAVFGRAQEALHWLPFRYIISAPIEIAMGRIDSAALPQLLGVQALWVAVFGLVAWAMWRIGLRSFMATGG